MQLAVEKDAAVQVLLRAVAELLVLHHDVFEKVGDLHKVGVGGLGVPVDLVLHVRLRGGDGHAALDEEEMGAARIVKVMKEERWRSEGSVGIYVTVEEALG